MNRHLSTLAVIAAAVLVIGLAVVVTDHSSALGGAPRSPVHSANSSFGRILVDRRGRTLYLFEKDKARRSACSGVCATYWPPLLAPRATMPGSGLKGSRLSTIKRAGGARQVTYAGHPLYRFSGDKAPGQANGQGTQLFGGGWYVVSPAGKKIEDEGDDTVGGGYR